MAHVEAQLHRRGYLVDVLPAWPGGAHEEFRQFRIVDGNRICNSMHLTANSPLNTSSPAPCPLPPPADRTQVSSNAAVNTAGKQREPPFGPGRAVTQNGRLKGARNLAMVLGEGVLVD